jgi:hypothetical protein
MHTNLIRQKVWNGDVCVSEVCVGLIRHGGRGLWVRLICVGTVS